MEYLIIILLLVVNTILLIAIAGSVAKVIKYLGGEPEEPPEIQVDQRLLDFPVNYDGVTPLPPNADGVGGSIE